MVSKEQKRMLIFLVGLIIIFYLQYYNQISDKLELIQTDISDIHINMLFERIPIIINEPMVNPDDLTRTIFKWLYVYKKFTAHQDATKVCKARYTVLYSEQAEHVVHLRNPKYEESVSIQLAARQCVIIPYKWLITSSKEVRVQIIELHDILTIFSAVW
jgi:hypothetical protein